jgi:prolyl-tRNA editing enzyme YbaK/EbsC (Cys-tRNA(Pro) deacylase)
MKPANLKVKIRLEQYGFEFKIRILPNAVRTAILAAEALDCAVGQIANSLIFKDKIRDQAVLVMCAGDRRVDLQKVKLATGIELGKADADFVRQQSGFTIGGVPPIAHANQLHTILDNSLQRHTAIWAAAGTPESVFCMSPQQLQEITAGAWLDIARP